MKAIKNVNRNKWCLMCLLVLVAVGATPWQTSRGANCPKYFCDLNGAYNCPTYPYIDCFDNWCDICDTGCAAQTPKQQKKCNAVVNGDMATCDAVFSFCSSTANRGFNGCNILCTCPIYGWIYSNCDGAWQSACKP
jgi:hypothetical protein